MIKPDSLAYIGPIMTMVNEAGLQITKLKMTQLATEDVYKLYANQVNQPHFK